MRTIPANALTKLATQYGTEPINIIEVQWVVDGARSVYSDKSAPGVKGKIVEMGSIDAQVSIETSDQSLTASCVLDDVDGDIKAILDSHDIHKRPCWVYQWFEGLAYEDKFLIFRGEVSTPIVWDEGARTVAFDIVTPLEDAEVGFSIEEGQFPAQPDDLVGQPWPLSFGTACDVPALPVRSARQGILRAGVGIADFTLPNRICQAGYLLCPVQSTGEKETFVGGVIQSLNTQGADEDCARDRCETIADLKFAYAQQLSYEHTVIEVVGGEFFPQGVEVTLDIDGGKFTGSFAGRVFTITSREHPDFAETELIPCAPVGARSFVRGTSYASRMTQIGGTGSFQGPDFDGTDCNVVEDDPNAQGRIADGGAAFSQKLLDDMPTSNFFWARSGSVVTLDTEDEVLYIANLLPGEVIRVASKRSLGAGNILQTVPSDLYTVVQADFQGYTVTQIIFDRPLSKEEGDFSDDIYVTMESSIGPNTAEIIAWLVEKYTDLVVDTVSFAAVAAKLENYPSHFALLERENIIEVIRNIAFQARCGINIVDGVVYIKYLSEEPTSVDTFDASDIDVNTLTISHTATEDLVTKHVLRWNKSLAKDPNTLILRHNVNKYGTIEQEYQYSIYNNFSLVEKSGTFWMIRKANTWRRVSFSTSIHKLAVEVLDCITLDIPHIAPVPVKAIVESTKYNSDNNTIDFECWLPLKSGTTAVYPLAWPANVSATTTFPTEEEIAAGHAGGGPGDNEDTTPPAGHILGAVTIPNDDGFIQGWGDKYPSDLDDELPEIICPAGDDIILDEPDPVIEARKRANRALQKTKDAAETPAMSVNLQEENQQKGCGGKVGPYDCIYQVDVQYCTPQTIFRRVGEDPFLDSSPGASGRIAICGPQTNFCHQFNSLTMAQYFQQDVQQRVDAKNDAYGFTVGTQDEVGAFFVGEVLRGEKASDCKEPPADQAEQTGVADGAPSVPPT
jgi:hypothetical protein